MTEERSCKTCKHGGGTFCKSDDGPCSSFVTHQHWEPKNPQPIQKAPSFQMTEEEAREKLDRIIPWGLIESQNEEAFLSAFIGNLKDAGLIRKSSLVELVEEAEELWSACYRNTELEPSNLNAKLYQALQALKKIIKSSEVRNDNKK